MKKHELYDSFSKKVAEELGISEEIIYEVIRWQWKSANKALNSEKSVEISGLGKFLLRPKPIAKRIKLLNTYINAYNKRIATTEDENKVRTLNRRIENMQSEIDFLNTKLQ